jgi:succinate-semialdehyde dehydrogenase/glutarate-semialdehyde dehydrogenase
MAIATLNPASGEILRNFPPMTDDEVDQRLERSRRAFQSHRLTSLEERAACLRRAAAILEDERLEFARLMTMEMGKPLKAAADEASKCATACRYYAGHGENLLRQREAPDGPRGSFVRFAPIGTVLAVMPWNFPFWQVFRFAAPALMAGNTAILKHASNVPQCALAIEEIFRRSGFLPDVFQTLLIGAGAVAKVIGDPRISAVTLTGSELAGIQVAEMAGKSLKKAVLELGGSDPFVVMPTAPLEEAARTAVRARTINNGQSCIAAKRFIVHEAVYDEFVARFVDGMNNLRVGDPMDPRTDVGPLATAQILADLEDQVRRAVDAGATVLTGGRRPDSRGYYYPPTVLSGLPPGAGVAREEVFGPVAMVFRVSSLDEAIEVANATDFGLGASAWTMDAYEREQFIDRLEAGLVFINGMVASDARLPFGGVKRSGFGRELGEYGILEFVNIKTICVNDV